MLVRRPPSKERRYDRYFSHRRKHATGSVQQLRETAIELQLAPVHAAWSTIRAAREKIRPGAVLNGTGSV